MNFKAFHLFSELFIYISWFHIFNLHSFSFAVWEENYLKKDTFLLSLLCGKTLFVENQLSSRCLTSSTLKAKGPLKLKLLINYKKEIFRFRGWWSHRDPDPCHWKWRNCDQVISVEEKWRRSGAVEKAPAMHKLSDSSLSGIIVDIITLIVTIITLITINNSVDHLHYQYSTMIDWSSSLLCTVDNDQTKKPQIIRFRFVIVFGFFLSSRRVWKSCTVERQLPVQSVS